MDADDLAKFLGEKFDQIPKDIIEGQIRFDKTFKELENWLNNSGLTFHQVISLLEIMKTKYMNHYLLQEKMVNTLLKKSEEYE